MLRGGKKLLFTLAYTILTFWKRKNTLLAKKNNHISAKLDSKISAHRPPPMIILGPSNESHERAIYIIRNILAPTSPNSAT